MSKLQQIHKFGGHDASGSKRCTCGLLWPCSHVPHSFSCGCSRCIAEIDSRPKRPLSLLQAAAQRRETALVRAFSEPAAAQRRETALVRAFSEPPSFSNTPESEAWRDYHEVDA